MQVQGSCKPQGQKHIHPEKDDAAHRSDAEAPEYHACQRKAPAFPEKLSGPQIDQHGDGQKADEIWKQTVPFTEGPRKQGADRVENQIKQRRMCVHLLIIENGAVVETMLRVHSQIISEVFPGNPSVFHGAPHIDVRFIIRIRQSV